MIALLFILLFAIACIVGLFLSEEIVWSLRRAFTALSWLPLVTVVAALPLAAIVLYVLVRSICRSARGY